MVGNLKFETDHRFLSFLLFYISIVSRMILAYYDDSGSNPRLVIVGLYFATMAQNAFLKRRYFLVFRPLRITDSFMCFDFIYYTSTCFNTDFGYFLLMNLCLLSMRWTYFSLSIFALSIIYLQLSALAFNHSY